MKRRAFFGLLGGAAVAGPSMVKQAAVATLADAQLVGIATAANDFVGGVAPQSMEQGPAEWVSRLGKLALRSNSEHQERIRGGWVNGLDPDLAVNRSMALHAKIFIQKRRNYWRDIENEKSWLQRRIDGLMDW